MHTRPLTPYITYIIYLPLAAAVYYIFTFGHNLYIIYQALRARDSRFVYYIFDSSGSTRVLCTALYIIYYILMRSVYYVFSLGDLRMLYIYLKLCRKYTVSRAKQSDASMHGRQTSQTECACKDCGGTETCEHGRQKS